MTFDWNSIKGYLEKAEDTSENENKWARLAQISGYDILRQTESDLFMETNSELKMSILTFNIRV